MPKAKRLQGYYHLHTTLPPSTSAKMLAYLYSPAEQTVPRGAIQDFLVNLIEDFFRKQHATTERLGSNRATPPEDRGGNSNAG